MRLILSDVRLIDVLEMSRQTLQHMYNESVCSLAVCLSVWRYAESSVSVWIKFCRPTGQCRVQSTYTSLEQELYTLGVNSRYTSRVSLKK